jgi:hypothetical protein
VKSIQQSQQLAQLEERIATRFSEVVPNLGETND